MTTLKCTKRAWVRNPGAPIGEPALGRISCPCGHAPQSAFRPGPNITCACGAVYTWDGWVVTPPTKQPTTYGILKIGQRFMVPDTDEFTLVKKRHYALVLETGVAVGVDDDEIVDLVGPEPILNDHVTEIERLAITMLADHGSTLHPALGEWMRALCADPDEMRWMDEYAVAETVLLNDETTPLLADFCRSQGFVIALDPYFSGAHAIADSHPTTRSLTQEEGVLARYDRAAFYLASALRQYREDGRPEGDQTEVIMGMGAPLLELTTSLAAACHEYHMSMLNLAFQDYAIWA